MQHFHLTPWLWLLDASSDQRLIHLSGIQGYWLWRPTITIFCPWFPSSWVCRLPLTASSFSSSTSSSCTSFALPEAVCSPSSSSSGSSGFISPYRNVKNPFNQSEPPSSTSSNQSRTWDSPWPSPSLDRPTQMRGDGEGVVGVDGRKVEEQNVEVKERREVVTKLRKRRVWNKKRCAGGKRGETTGEGQRSLQVRLYQQSQAVCTWLENNTEPSSTDLDVYSLKIMNSCCVLIMCR